MRRYKWRGRRYLLLKDLVEVYGSAIRSQWLRTPKEFRLSLNREVKESFCASNEISHPSYQISLLLDTDEAWFSLLGIPRTEAAKDLCAELKDSSFDFFWFGKRREDLEEKLQEMEKEKASKVKRLRNMGRYLEALKEKQK
jgi:hypothetical protein